MGFEIFNVIIWFFAGIINLASEKISRLSYGMTWGVLMMYLIIYCFK